MTAAPGRGLFVLGCPRSGTTAIGRYIASSPDVCDLGEYGGFHVALHHAPRELRRMPGPHKAAYLSSLAMHADDFARSTASREGCGWYLDDTPWNLLSADELARQVSDAILVLCLRHYRGTIQSLQRSYSQGFTFAGSVPAESAKVWSRFYANAARIDTSRLVTVSYDRLCAEPDSTLDQLDWDLERAGLPSSEFDRRVFASSHAVPAAGPRPTVAQLDPDSGTVLLTPRPSYNPDTWTAAMENEVRPVVRTVDAVLAHRFPDVYVTPTPRRITRDGTLPLPTT